MATFGMYPNSLCRAAVVFEGDTSFITKHWMFDDARPVNYDLNGEAATMKKKQQQLYNSCIL